jgi:hypothetical protein
VESTSSTDAAKPLEFIENLKACRRLTRGRKEGNLNRLAKRVLFRKLATLGPQFLVDAAQ